MVGKDRVVDDGRERAGWGENCARNPFPPRPTAQCLSLSARFEKQLIAGISRIKHIMIGIHEPL